jgi:hypothetical protein
MKFQLRILKKQKSKKVKTLIIQCRRNRSLLKKNYKSGKTEYTKKLKIGN